MAQIRRRRRMQKSTCPCARAEDRFERLRQLVSEMKDTLNELQYTGDQPQGVSLGTKLAPGGDPEVAKRELVRQARLKARDTSQQFRKQIEMPHLPPEKIRELRAKLQKQGLFGKKGDIPAIHKPSGKAVIIRGSRAT